MVDNERRVLRLIHEVNCTLGLDGLSGKLLTLSLRPWIQSFATKLKGKPLLDLLGTVIEDYEFLWDEYYFPTATM